MIALIAEKPSVAKDIARIIGATQKNDGYLFQVTGISLPGRSVI